MGIATTIISVIYANEIELTYGSVVEAPFVIRVSIYFAITCLRNRQFLSDRIMMVEEGCERNVPDMPQPM